MEKIIRKKRGFLAFLLAMMLGTTCFFSSVTNVEAAKNKALRIGYSFKNLNYVDNGTDCGDNNLYYISVAGTKKKVAIKDLKMSADIYVPKAYLKKKGATLDFNVGLGLTDNGDSAFTHGKISPTVMNVDGKIYVTAWDTIKNKDVKASSYISCKAGKGAYKNYYVIKLKNIPFEGKMQLGEKTKKITSKTKKAVEMELFITGQNSKHSGNLYIDNMKLTSGKKTVVNQTFTKKPTLYGVYNRGKYTMNTQNKKKIAIVSF